MSDGAQPGPPHDPPAPSQPPLPPKPAEAPPLGDKLAAAGRDLTETTVHGGITGGAHSTFNLFGGAPSPRPEWTDPAHRIDLPAPLPLEALSLGDKLEALRERRVLVVECLWSEHQLRAAATIVTSLGAELLCARGEVTDDRESLALAAPAAGERRRFGLEDLERAELGGQARVLLLELEGAAGTSYLDTLFATAGSYRAVTAALRRADRYLLLLPRGGTRNRALARRNLAGHPLPRLCVPHLEAWLSVRFPAHAAPLADLLRQKLIERDWDDEGAQWDWLCSLPPGLDAAQLQRELTEDAGEPLPLAEVRQALERCDDRDLPFLTTVFVATYLPSLPQHDFAEAVRGLLGNRTRLEQPASPAPGAPSLPPREIELAAEWLRLGRALWRRADLELQGTSVKLVGFRASRAQQLLRRELDASPLFLYEQLEHLRNASLLFHPRSAVSEAVLELLAAIAARDPGQLDASWLLTLIKQHRLSMASTAASTAATEDRIADEEHWGSYKLVRVLKLLRRLLSAPPTSGDDSAPTSQSPAASPGQAIVDQVIEGMLRGGQRLATASLVLAFHLRSAPGFELWRWLRTAFDLELPEVDKLATALLGYLVNEPVEGPETLRLLFRWLGHEDHELSPAGKATVAAISVALGQSLRQVVAPVTDERSGATSDHQQQAPALIALMLAQLPDTGREPALELELKVMLSLLAAHITLEEAAPADLARLLLPHALLSELPGATHSLRVASLGLRLERRLAEHLGASPSNEDRTAARLALLLAGWHLAHPAHAELWRATATAAAQVLGTSRKLARRWLAMLREALLESESDPTGAPLPAALQRRWMLELGVRRRALTELGTWLEPGTQPSPQPSGPSASAPSA